MKSILFLLDNPFENDMRVRREALSLVKNGFKVLLIAVKKEGLPVNEISEGIIIHRLFNEDIYDIKRNRCYDKYARVIYNNYKFDIIHAHDQFMLNLGVKIKKINSKIILLYDSHELFFAWPLNTNAKGMSYIKSLVVRAFLKRREARNFRFIDALISVNESIRKEILTHFNIDIPSEVIRNIPEIPFNLSNSNVLKEKFNLASTDKILVYIGSNIYPKTINIEQVIRDFANKTGVYMIFICSKNWGQKEVEEYSIKTGVKNLYFHDIIPATEIPFYLSSADVGIVSSWNKKDLSYWYGLDNKLFEYIMAGIPVLATQQPEYIKIVENYKVGICINPDQENYFDAFTTILSNYNFYTENIIKAKEDLNWEKESNVLLNFYRKIII